MKLNCGENVPSLLSSLFFSCFFLDKILERLTSTPENSMEVDGAEQASGEELGALVKNCKFNMKLQMADSAWKQVLRIYKYQCWWLVGGK